MKKNANKLQSVAPVLLRSQTAKQPRYYIRSCLCLVITLASVLVMLAGSAAIIAFLLYYRMLYWVDQVVTSSILLNIQIMSESAALNV